MEIFPIYRNLQPQLFFDDDGNKRKRGSKGIFDCQNSEYTYKLVHLGDGVRRVGPKSLIG